MFGQTYLFVLDSEMPKFENQPDFLVFPLTDFLRKWRTK